MQQASGMNHSWAANAFDCAWRRALLATEPSWAVIWDERLAPLAALSGALASNADYFAFLRSAPEWDPRQRRIPWHAALQQLQRRGIDQSQASRLLLGQVNRGLV